jgi:hypothetical protein
MKAQLHHTALNVANFVWYKNFFTTLFEMTILRTAETAAERNRKVWFAEGIQLNEVSVCNSFEAGIPVIDHISLAVDSIPLAITCALKVGCSKLSEGDHWFSLPNGVKVELKKF